MWSPPSRHETVRHVSTAALALALVTALGAIGYGAFEWFAHQAVPVALAFIGAGVAGLLVATLLYCQVVLIWKFVSYAYRSYDTLLETQELLRRQEEHGRTIAENSNLSDWAKRVVYREKDYEFLRDTIQGAIVRQDWEAAEHLIRDMATQFGYHDEAASLREKLNRARQATTEERVANALARFDALCEQHKWQQALAECQRLRTLFPHERAIVNLPRELERRRQEVKQSVLKEYEEAVKKEDIERAHRLLFELDLHIAPKEAEALKESARNVFRARLEQIKTKFTIAVSYKQFHTAIEAGEQLIREFPNSGYAHEIAKLLPILRQRAAEQPTHAVPAETSAHP